MIMCCVWVDVKHKLCLCYVLLCYTVNFVNYVMLRYAFYSFTIC